jgi:hypothetical protein
LDILNRCIHKALVILVGKRQLTLKTLEKFPLFLLGPIHVSSSYEQKANLLKDRCKCSKNQTKEFMDDLSDQWTREFEKIQAHMQEVRRPTFNALALPMLTVHSRYPYSVFIPYKV